MKYLKLFNDNNEYQAFVGGGDYVIPNVSYIEETQSINLQEYKTPSLAGDVAYWDGSNVKTTPLSNWNTSLGTPVGVVVIPEGFATDGRPRIVSLLYVDKDGNTSTSYQTIGWIEQSSLTPETDFTRVPTTDNAGSTSTGSADYGYLPSDKFTGTTSYVDTKAKYYGDTPMIPSPYLGETPNPEYYKEISGYINILSDFNGLSNTQTLVGLDPDCNVPNAAW